jgi:hypothetical protein
VDYEGPAVIEWQANNSFALVGSLHLQVVALERGWLVFPDGSAFEVAPGRPEPDGSFELWAWSEDGERPDACPGCALSEWDVSVTDGRNGAVSIVDRCTSCGVERRSVFPGR